MRVWLYEKLTTDPGVSAIFGNRVFQGGSLDSSLTTKPYIVYVIGNDTDEALSEDSDVSRQFFMIYLHDVPGDYVRIDAGVQALKDCLVNASGPGITTVRYLETSRDLDDETLNTINRYVRFQAVRRQ